MMPFKRLVLRSLQALRQSTTLQTISLPATWSKRGCRSYYDAGLARLYPRRARPALYHRYGLSVPRRPGSYEGIDMFPKGIAWCQENITPRNSNLRFQV